MQLIDTHVHLNFDLFQSDLSSVRTRWRDNGIVRLVHSSVEPEEFSAISAIADRFPEVSYAVGLHPLDAGKWNSETATRISSWATNNPKVVAIGETGLDFYKADDREQQFMVFESQIRIAAELNLPVIIHCRDAAQQVRDILQKSKQRFGDRTRGVMHCWGGTAEETQWFLDLGFYISFSGTVTFKNAVEIQKSAAMVSSDRLLIETDCPFLAPTPKRGKRNEPAFVRYVAEQVAKIRGESVEAIASITTRNACELFGLTL